MDVEEIEREVLNSILHESKTSHPNVFGGILKSDKKRITKVAVLSGPFSSDRSALKRLSRLPVTSNDCGSVHSHASYSLRPSRSDLNLLSEFGDIHIIVTPPYNEGSWKAFNSRGQQVRLEVVETESEERVSEKFSEDFKI